jgi:hypothetical protein
VIPQAEGEPHDQDDQDRAGRRIEAQKKKPRRLAEARFRYEMHIFGLQVLDEASHTPPALSQSSFVLANARA